MICAHAIIPDFRFDPLSPRRTLKNLLVPLDRLADFDEIIDVRTPLEFADDHIPGALNAPVLSNEERVVIGTMYKQVSPFEAARAGAAMVARNIAQHLDTIFAGRPRNWRPRPPSSTSRNASPQVILKRRCCQYRSRIDRACSGRCSARCRASRNPRKNGAIRNSSARCAPSIRRGLFLSRRKAGGSARLRCRLLWWTRFIAVIVFRSKPAGTTARRSCFTTTRICSTIPSCSSSSYRS